MTKLIIYIFFVCFISQSCTDNISQNSSQTLTENSEEAQTLAKITAVDCIGQPNNYTFSVTIESPDLGCDQYADWWEVITVDSILIYRRILTHSHVDEQPFTRNGGVVNVGADDFVFVRAHMNNLGYGDQVFSGTPRQGLVPDSLDQNFGITLEILDPLPNGCAF